MKKPCWGSLELGCGTLALLAGLTSVGCSSSSGNSGAGGDGVILTGNGGTAGSSAGSATAGDAGRNGDGGSGASAGLGGANSAGFGGGGGHAGSAGSAGHSGSTGQSGSGGAAATGVIGDACAADTDCPAGLTCLLADDPTLASSGGPANGLCTLVCLSNSDCTKAEAGASCVDFGGGAAYCLEPCTPGDPADVSAKCHGRTDMACSSFDSGVTYSCNPLCRADIECGTGLFCDRSSGLCVASKPSGDPVGTACDPTAATNSCLGICLATSAAGVVPATGACVELCSIGTECMYSGTKPGGYCVGALSASSGALDLGYCEASCNCDENCKLPGDICTAFPSSLASVKTDLSTAGVCFPKTSGSTELTTCN